MAALAVHSHDDAGTFCLVLEDAVFLDVGLGALSAVSISSKFAHDQVETVQS